MHIVDLGIWVHLLTCIAWRVDKTLKKYHVLPASRVMGVWDKLHTRARLINQDDAMFKLNWYKINFIKVLLQERLSSHDAKHTKKKIQAWEHHVLMNVSLPPPSPSSRLRPCIRVPVRSRPLSVL